jgi:hypothetical protein
MLLITLFGDSLQDFNNKRERNVRKPTTGMHHQEYRYYKKPTKVEAVLSGEGQEALIVTPSGPLLPK